MPVNHRDVATFVLYSDRGSLIKTKDPSRDQLTV